MATLKSIILPAKNVEDLAEALLTWKNGRDAIVIKEILTRWLKEH